MELIVDQEIKVSAAEMHMHRRLCRVTRSDRVRERKKITAITG